MTFSSFFFVFFFNLFFISSSPCISPPVTCAILPALAFSLLLLLRCRICSHCCPLCFCLSRCQLPMFFRLALQVTKQAAATCVSFAFCFSLLPSFLRHTIKSTSRPSPSLYLYHHPFPSRRTSQRILNIAFCCWGPVCSFGPSRFNFVLGSLQQSSNRLLWSFSSSHQARSY